MFKFNHKNYRNNFQVIILFIAFDGEFWNYDEFLKTKFVSQTFLNAI